MSTQQPEKIHFACPHCNRRLQAYAHAVGMQETCPGCKNALIIEAGGMASVPLAQNGSSASIKTTRRQEKPGRPQPTNPSTTDTTRYLCAANYIDPIFRNYVYHVLAVDRYSAIAETPGVDLRLVARHCWNASSRIFRRDMLAISIWVATWLLVFVSPMFSLVALVAAGILGVLDRWETYYTILATELSSRHPTDTESVQDDNSLPRRVEEALACAAPVSRNVVVYSGFSPFAGSGEELSGWSFAVNTAVGKASLDGTREAPSAIDERDLYRHLESCMAASGLEGVITITDQVLVNGLDATKFPEVLADRFSRPEHRVSGSFLKSCSNGANKECRSYKRLRVTSWSGDVIVSLFYRFSKWGDSLFVEVNYRILLPIREYYRVTDRLHQKPTIKQALGTVLLGVLTGCLLYAFAPIVALGHLWSFFKERFALRRQRRDLEETPLFDYGAYPSIREYASRGNYRRYFQKLDQEMFTKTVNQVFLDSLVGFLDIKGVDTSTLSERSESILNTGVMVTGGNVTIGSLAAGTYSAVKNVLGVSKPSAK